MYKNDVMTIFNFKVQKLSLKSCERMKAQSYILLWLVGWVGVIVGVRLKVRERIAKEFFFTVKQKNPFVEI
jgi:hypothetical protein